MAMPVRVVAFAIRGPVFVVRHLRIVQAVRRGETIPPCQVGFHTSDVSFGSVILPIEIDKQILRLVNPDAVQLGLLQL